MTDEQLTKVHIDLPNHWATGGEALWANAVGPAKYRIANVPFFAYDLNDGDTVEAIERSPDRKPSVLRVWERSGHRTLRVFFAQGIAREHQTHRLESLRELAVSCERKDGRYVALDLEPSSDINAVRDRLDSWQAEGIADYETCEARIPGSFDDVPDPSASDAV